MGSLSLPLKMGLEESVNEAGDIFITEIYITSAGLKECRRAWAIFDLYFLDFWTFFYTVRSAGLSLLDNWLLDEYLREIEIICKRILTGNPWGKKTRRSTDKLGKDN